MMRLAGCLLAVTALRGAQGPRIFIVTDMEGVGGVHNWDEQATVGQRRFEESRRLLTGEVNAAIQGALEAGAAEVAVWDGHGGSRTLSVEDLHAGARLIQGPRTPADFYLAEKRYEGILFVGQHAKAGTANGLMPPRRTSPSRTSASTAARSANSDRRPPSRVTSRFRSSC